MDYSDFMNTFTDTIKYFFTITVELTVLFIGISTIERVQASQKKIKN